MWGYKGLKSKMNKIQREQIKEQKLQASSSIMEKVNNVIRKSEPFVYAYWDTIKTYWADNEPPIVGKYKIMGLSDSWELKKLNQEYNKLCKL
jgi:hypothetical protein